MKATNSSCSIDPDERSCMVKNQRAVSAFFSAFV